MSISLALTRSSLMNLILRVLVMTPSSTTSRKDRSRAQEVGTAQTRHKNTRKNRLIKHLEFIRVLGLSILFKSVNCYEQVTHKVLKEAPMTEVLQAPPPNSVGASTRALVSL